MPHAPNSLTRPSDFCASRFHRNGANMSIRCPTISASFLKRNFGLWGKRRISETLRETTTHNTLSHNIVILDTTKRRIFRSKVDLRFFIIHLPSTKNQPQKRDISREQVTNTKTQFIRIMPCAIVHPTSSSQTVQPPRQRRLCPVLGWLQHS